MTPSLEIEHLKAGYGRTVILKDISFKVMPGEIYGILGSSGCGKSTLLSNILQLEKPLGGKITLFGNVLDARVPMPDALRKRTGVLFQGGALLSSLTVAQNAALPIRRHYPELPESMVDSIVAENLEKVHMLDAFHKFPSELSGGMKKRAALARALVLNPELLFCDEPTAGLDPVSSRSLDELLLELRDSLKISVITVTHELESFKTICDKFVFLKDGNVLMNASLKEGLESEIPDIKHFFRRENSYKEQKNEYFNFNFI